MNAEIRKIQTVVEETRMEQGQVVDPPIRRATCTAVVRNPFAGRYVEDLSPLYNAADGLGEIMVAKLLEALKTSGQDVHSFGKAALVGEDGELEHAAAFLHPKLGAPIRKALEGGASLIPSSKKRSGPGAPFDIPLGYKDAARVRSHFDGIEVRISDAPRADEIAISIAFTTGGRPLPRVGGLQLDEVEGIDGVK